MLFNFLYGDVAKKIKGFAKIIFIIVAIGFFVCGVSLFKTAIGYDEYGNFSLNDNLLILSIVVWLGGTVVGWFSTLILYGFGELIANTKKEVEE